MLLPFGGAGFFSIGKKVVGGTNGALLVTDTSGLVASLADVATGQVLTSGGAGAIPTYSGSPTLTTSLTVPTVYGSSSASGNLLLQSTSNATRGFVQIEDLAQLGTSAHAWAATTGYYLAVATGNLNITTGSLGALGFTPTITAKGNSSLTLGGLFNAAATITDDGTARTVGPMLVFTNNFTYTATVAGTTAADLAGIPAYCGLYHNLTMTRTGGGTMALTTAAAVYVSNQANIGVGCTVTNYYGLLFNPPTISGTITNIAVVKSTLAAATNRFFLQDTGGAQSQFAGLFTKYGNVNTVGLGVPAIYGLDSRTGLTGADGAATTLYTTVAANGIFRISADIFATAAVTGTATYSVKWTENATTQTMAVTATAINTLGTQSNIIRPDNATAITAQLTGVFTGTFTVVGLVEQLA